MVRTVFLNIYQIIRLNVTRHVKYHFEPYVYVALGDSTVEGIGATHPRRTYTHIIYSLIKQVQRRAIYHNFGKKSARIQDVIDFQLDKTIAAKPNLVTISIGANDIIHHTGIRVFEKKLILVIERIKNETKAQTVINNIPNFSLLPVVPKHLRIIANLQIKRYNRVIDELAKKYKVIHIDMYAQSTLYAKHFPEALAEDNFHPSDFGYALWANTIITSIQHLFLKPTAELK